MPRPPVIAALLLFLAAPLTARAQGLGQLERVVGPPPTVVDMDASGARWAVLLEDGSVRVHDPKGPDAFLRPARREVSETDDAVLRMEGLLGDLADAEEAFEIGEEPEDTGIDDVSSGADDQVEELLQGEQSLRDGVSGPQSGGVLRWGVGDRIGVSRGDGVWISEDAGRRWRRIWRFPARDLADTGTSWVVLLPGGEVLQNGVRSEVYLGPLVVEISDLAASDGTVWAATDVGLWRLGDNGWEPAGDSLDRLRGVVADPGWEGGLWATSTEGILRTDDGGVTWRLLEGGPRRGSLRWGGPAPGGALLVISGDGVWEHRDGGWLRDGRQLDLAIGSDVGTYAVADGVLLGPPTEDGELSEGPPVWLGLGDLLHTALSRRELTESVGAGRVVQTLMPEVVVEGSISPDQGIDYLPFTTASTGTDRRVMVRLRWTPAGRSAAGEAFEQTVEEIALRTGFDDLGIADRGVLGAMGGRVGRRATAYRSVLTDKVRDLYVARNSLYFERAASPANSLQDEVVWELRRAEIEAHLDALTDGAVSRWTSVQ